ncbi:MAG: M23 family metallopeptidase, partial [Clostridia bacterium]
MTSKFGNRTAPTAGASTFHSGIDIAAPEGSKLVSIMEGEVVATGWGGAGGYTITIKSVDGTYRFSYCHCSPEFIVSVGQKVKKGQILFVIDQVP